MSRIGIMGGTFNPIHNAHLAMAMAAYEQADLDRIWFMPSKNPPHKNSSEIISEEHRSNMIRLAIKNTPYFAFSDFELHHEGTTYTAQTLKRLHKIYPEHQFCFIMGGDSLFELETWYHPEQIMKMTTILAFSRNGETMQRMQERAAYLTGHYQADIRVLSMPDMPISSSLIRSRILSGQPVNQMIPPAVEKYISREKLYKTHRYTAKEV